jgi:chemotaxis protein MotA
MFAIIGIVVVFACVVAGYLMEHGNLRVLIQPTELIIIGGAAVGTLLVANPLHILKKIANGIGGVFGGSKFGKQTYIQTLKMMYDLLNKARKDGLMALESDVEEPEKSAVFSKNPSFLKNHHVRNFVCDSLRMAITGIDAFDLDQMLDLDLEVHHQDSAAPTAALSTMADSLPGLGSWLPYSGWSSPWELWVVRPKRLDTRSLPRWWERSWEFFSATDWSARSRPI